VNKFVKLTVEVFSKMSKPVEIGSLELKMNTKILDIKIDFLK